MEVYKGMHNKSPRGEVLECFRELEAPYDWKNIPIPLVKTID